MAKKTVTLIRGQTPHAIARKLEEDVASQEVRKRQLSLSEQAATLSRLGKNRIINAREAAKLALKHPYASSDPFFVSRVYSHVLSGIAQDYEAAMEM